MKESISFSFLFSVSCLLLNVNCFSQWVQKASIPTPGRFAGIGFSIGTKGYVGTGVNSAANYLNDLWEWDPTTNTWTQKAALPTTQRAYAVGFSIGNKGYIATGFYTTAFNDLWEYDQPSNSWTQKANFPGGPMSGAEGFSIGTKGYVGFGNATNAFWEWDQTTNTWTPKANFPGIARMEPGSFVVGNKAYFGFGYIGTTFYNDLWEWNQITNSWTQKANLPGPGRIDPSSFTIGSYGFIAVGWNNSSNTFYNDFWMFDPLNNQWTQLPNFGGAARVDAVSFSINSCGYIGTGWNGSYFNDFWEYCTGSIPLNITASSTNVSCYNSCNGTATANSTGGNPPYTYLWSNGETAHNITGLCAGTYSVLVSDANGSTSTTIVNITQPNALSATVNTTPSLCGNNNGTANISVSGGTQPYTYSWSNGGYTNSISGLPGGAYSVTVTDANGCTTVQSVLVSSTPPVNAHVSNDTTIEMGATINLWASGGANYVWSNGHTEAVITVSPTTTTTYCVIVYDSLCTDTACVTVQVEPIDCSLDFYFPNAFSPNGDEPNQYFRLYGKKECIESFHICIFNRWGEKVFESHDATFRWDGMYRGNKLNASVFIYYYDIKTIYGTQIHRQGNISLIR